MTNVLRKLNLIPNLLVSLIKLIPKLPKLPKTLKSLLVTSSIAKWNSKIQQSKDISGLKKSTSQPQTEDTKMFTQPDIITVPNTTTNILDLLY